MARGEPQIKIRFPVEMHQAISAAAKANGRSMNAEIVARLATGFSTSKPLTADDLAEALGAFWNAAISEAHNRQSTAAMDCASVIATGIAAVAEYLKGES